MKGIEVDEEGIKKFFVSLLEKVDALLVPIKTDFGSVPSLLVRKENISLLDPFSKSYYLNAASYLGRISSGRKLGALLRPCEIRAVVELVKLRQIERKSLLIVGMDCDGTYKEEKLRPACELCRWRTPEKDADLAIFFIGMEKPALVALSAGGEELLEDAGEIEFQEERERKLSELLQNAEKRRKELFAEVEKKDLEGWLSLFSSCISCHNCRRICPLCYCKECFFDTPLANPSGEELLQQARIKGALKMPLDPVFYHLVRIFHVVTTCVGCGSCEEGCPAEIPLTSIYSSLAEKVQSIFGYEAGRSREEPLPLTIFKEEL
jgi:formate dehydrogenase subunit beta